SREEVEDETFGMGLQAWCAGNDVVLEEMDGSALPLSRNFAGWAYVIVHRAACDFIAQIQSRREQELLEEVNYEHSDSNARASSTEFDDGDEPIGGMKELLTNDQINALQISLNAGLDRDAALA